MRSDLVFLTLKEFPNRYSMCRMLMVGTRKLHKTGTRFQDTINHVLSSCGGNGGSPATGEPKATVSARLEAAA